MCRGETLHIFLNNNLFTSKKLANMKTTKIKVTANKTKKRYTIRKYEGGKCVAKYRTFKMSKSEFNEAEYNTTNDWINFLKTENYYKV